MPKDSSRNNWISPNRQGCSRQGEMRQEPYVSIQSRRITPFSHILGILEEGAVTHRSSDWAAGLLLCSANRESADNAFIAIDDNEAEEHFLKTLEKL